MPIRSNVDRVQIFLEKYPHVMNAFLWEDGHVYIPFLQLADEAPDDEVIALFNALLSQIIRWLIPKQVNHERQRLH